MSLWEYKVITSGKGGFASPALLEKFLNDLGREEWEIVCFQTAPENFLAFTGLARRSTQRDWTLEDAAAAAAKAEAEKLRAEFEAKFKAASAMGGGGGAGEERAPSFLEEKTAPDDGFRKPIDTSRDDEPEAAEEEKDEWDELAQEDELPTFFDAIKPHMRRNQRGPGMSVGVDYLAKKWDQSEEDLKGALAECGFVVPEDEDAKPEYLEYDGDLYWLNINRRGELWINTKEKPRPVFRSVKAQKIAVEEEAPRQPERQRHAAPAESEPKPEGAEGVPASAEAGDAAKSEGGEPEAKGGGTKPLPEGAELLRKIRPHMRRNRRGPGGSGSTSFLSRALRTTEADLKAAFVALGFTIPASANDKPVNVEIANEVWWLNLDSRGGLWINGREKRKDEAAGAPAEAAPGSAAPDAVPAPEVAPSASGAPTEQPASATETGAPAAAASESPAAASERAREVAPVPAATPAAGGASDAGGVLAGLRLLLKETKSGSIAGKVDRLAQELSKSADNLVATLVGAGLKAPEKQREKPVFVEHAGEIFWLNRNARGELWLNAKPSKFADKADDEAEGDDESDAGESGAGGESAEGDGEKKPRRSRSRGRKSE